MTVCIGCRSMERRKAEYYLNYFDIRWSCWKLKSFMCSEIYQYLYEWRFYWNLGRCLWQGSILLIYLWLETCRVSTGNPSLVLVHQLNRLQLSNCFAIFFSGIIAMSVQISI